MMLSKAVRRQLSRVPRRWRPATVLATWFGVGLLPWTPGTWASLASLPFAWVIVEATGGIGLLCAAALVFAVGCWASGVYEQEAGTHDPSTDVIDEVAAQWVVLAWVPPDVGLYLAGFVFFRAADMIKIWPANVLDRRLTGGAGIMLDDMVAALYAAAGVYVLSRWIL